MVHTKLIETGQVQKLSYRQLRRLEKLDIQKNRETELIKFASEAAKALGNASAGLSVGIGNALNGYLSGDAIAFAAKSIEGLILFEWFLNSYPNIAHALHLDALLFSGANPNSSPYITSTGSGGSTVTTGPGTVPSSLTHPGAQPNQPGGATIAGAGGGNTVFNAGQGPQPQTAQV